MPLDDRMLHDRCRWNEPRMVKEWLSTHPNINVLESLQFAIETNNTYIAQILLEHYEKQHLQKDAVEYENKLSVLQDAIDECLEDKYSINPEIRARLFRYSFQGERINFLDEDTFKLCDYCLIDADLERIEECLTADPYAEILHGALMFAVLTDNTDLVAILLTHYETQHFQKNRESMEYKTALHNLKSCLKDTLEFCDGLLSSKTKERLSRYVQFGQDGDEDREEYCLELTCSELANMQSLYCTLHSECIF